MSVFIKSLPKSLFLAVLLVLAGCSTIDGWVDGLTKEKAPQQLPLAKRPVQAPLDANRFVLHDDTQTLIGEPQVVFTRESDTFSDIARSYGLGYDELVLANPGIDPWRPGADTAVVLPTQYLLPPGERRGVVLNIASKRLFYFPQPAEGEPASVLTFPIGIGRVGWETPLGATTVIAKAKDPTWWVPASVRKEHAEMGDPLPAVVPPGPDNPLGHRVLKLDMPGYLIHGTNQPYGVGMRVSHGCVRLYPENIEFLYSLVDIGESVRIVNEPYLLGEQDGVLYFEGHPPLEDDTVPGDERLNALLSARVDAEGNPLNQHLQDQVRALSEAPQGLPLKVAEYAANEYLARVRVVENVIEVDPDAYTIEEIRAMMDDVEAEAVVEAQE